MLEPSPKARFEIDRALLKGETKRAVKIYRDEPGGGLVDAMAYVRLRGEQLHAERPHALPGPDGRPARRWAAALLAAVVLLTAGLLLFPHQPSRAPVEGLLLRVEQLLRQGLGEIDSSSGERERHPAREAARVAEQVRARHAKAPPAESPAPAAVETPPPMREERVRPTPPKPAVVKEGKGASPLLESRAGELVIDLYRDFRYERRGFPFRLSSGQTPLPLVRHLPDPPLVRPGYRGTPLYGHFPLGSGPAGRILFAIDPGGDKWRVYADRNLNGDLTDDGPPLEGVPNENGIAGVEIDLNVALLGERRARPYRVWFLVRRDGEEWHAAFYARCHYAARIRLGNGIYSAVAFEQRDHNALFRDDGLWIDLDRDGKLTPSEHFDDGDSITVDGNRYPLRLAYR